jgi:hypothetical protein
VQTPEHYIEQQDEMSGSWSQKLLNSQSERQMHGLIRLLWQEGKQKSSSAKISPTLVKG